MKLESMDFDPMQTVTKKCITFARDGNTVVKPSKKLYPLTAFTNEEKHEGLFLEVVNSTKYRLWEQLADFCVLIGKLSEELTVEELSRKLQNYKFRGVGGYLSFLQEKKKSGGYINLVEIETCKLLEQLELATHYAEYRGSYRKRQEEREKVEQARRKQDEQERKVRKEAEKEQKLLQAEEVLKSRETLHNEKFENSTIVLALMKRHNIEVPLRTQGWINKALATIDFNQGRITYSYYSRSSNSKVFQQYLSILQERIDKGDCHVD